MLVRIFSSVCVYVLKGKDLDNKEKIELKRLRVTMVTKALFIFIGIILMQLIAYMLCVLGYTIFGIAQGIGYARALAEITILNTTKSTNLMLTISAVSAILSFIWCAILYKKSGFRAQAEAVPCDRFRPRNRMAVAQGHCPFLSGYAGIIRTAGKDETAEKHGHHHAPA